MQCPKGTYKDTYWLDAGLLTRPRGQGSSKGSLGGCLLDLFLHETFCDLHRWEILYALSSAGTEVYVISHVISLGTLTVLYIAISLCTILFIISPCMYRHDDFDP